MRFITRYTVVSDVPNISDVDDDRMGSALMAHPGVVIVVGHGVVTEEASEQTREDLVQALDDAAASLDDNEYHAEGDADEQDDKAQIARWRALRDQLEQEIA